MARGVAVIAGAGCSKEAWERAFGSDGERAKRFRKAKLEQDKRAAGTAAPQTAIHDDRYWGHKGKFEWCLGETITSRAHQKEFCKRHNMIENTDKWPK